MLKVGSTVPPLVPRRGDFDDWIAAGLGEGVACTVARPHEGEALPDAAGFAGVVVSGSSAMVTDGEPWSLAAEDWCAAAVGAGVPVLGICYGHQLLARALGGRAGWNPAGRHIGTAEVRLTEEGAREPLFAGLPETLVVQVSHQQSVLELPDGARRLATCAADPNHAFALGEHALGVQFHPEFDADIVRGYLEDRAGALAEEGLDAAALSAAARDSDHGPRILAAFARRVGG